MSLFGATEKRSDKMSLFEATEKRLYERGWLKHRLFDQPFEIKPQNPWGWKPQNYSGTGRDPIKNCEKGNESFWGYKEKVKNNLEKLFHALITIKPKSVEPEMDFSATGLFVTKLRNRLIGESTLWLSCVSIINIIEKLCLT